VVIEFAKNLNAFIVFTLSFFMGFNFLLLDIYMVNIGDDYLLWRPIENLFDLFLGLIFGHGALGESHFFTQMGPVVVRDSEEGVGEV
jgi:hypothetical protein